MNARTHGARNVGAVVSALKEVGAARSIVIDETGRVLAGNATVKAAGRAGITKLQVVDVDGGTIVAVRRTGLTEQQKVRLALFDNRAAELAEGWDAEMLAQLADSGVPMKDLWTDKEFAKLLGTTDETSVAAVNELQSQYLVMITCATEREQVQLLERFSAEGLECKALVS